MQRGQRLGVPLEQAFDPTAGGLQIDPGRADAHQHVRPGAGAQLASPMPGRPVVGLGSGDIVGQRLEADLDPRIVLIRGVNEIGETC